MLKKHSQFWESLLIIIDIFVISVAWVTSYYIRFYAIPVNGDVIPPLRDYIVVIVPIVIIWPFIFRNMGLYRPRRISSHAAEIFNIAKASSLALITLVSVNYFMKKFEFSRLVFLYFWSSCIFMLSVERMFFREVLRLFRRKGYNVRRVLIVGAGDLGKRVATKIKSNPWTGLNLVGYLDDYKPLGEEVEGKKVIGRISDLQNVVRREGIDQVFVALPIRAYIRLMYIIEKLRDEIVNVRVVPDIYQALTLSASFEDFEGLPLINLTDTPMYGWNVVAKRVSDIFFSLLALLITAPVMGLIAAGVKLTSPGPVFFRQRRYGLDGKVIWVYKFRTMTVCEDGQNVPQAKKGDSRITPFGSFLRRTSLDEIPQFFNVLKGEMSLVGPRPHAVAHNEYYRTLLKGYMLRHKVKPGITGWAQVNGFRGETDTIEKMENRVKYDLHYIENWSIWLDMKIMWLTIWKGLVNKNAY